MRFSARNATTVFCVLVFIFGVAVPFCLMLAANVTSLGYEGAAMRMRGGGGGGGGSERKLMRDFNPDSSMDGGHVQRNVRELEAIQASVRNELRTMEQYRSKMTHDIDYHKDVLSTLKKELVGVKQELQDARSKLARAAHDANKDSETLPQTVFNSAPIVVVRNELPVSDINPPLRRSLPRVGGNAVEDCTFEKCFRVSKCSLLEQFKVYVYNHLLRDLFDLRFPGVVSALVSSLALSSSLTEDPTQACVFLAVVGPLNKKESIEDIQQTLHSLSHWNGNGENHVLIDLSFTGSVFRSALFGVDTGRAIVAQSFFLGESPHRFGYDIVLPTVVAVETPRQPWKGLPPHLPVMRDTFLYFNMNFVGPTSDYALGPNQLKKFRDILQTQTSDKIVMNVECRDRIFVPESREGNKVFADDWISCDQADLINGTCFHSTFALILGDRYQKATPSTFATLINALRCGSIPVIVGVATLPFMEIIDWKQAAIFIPMERFGETHLILRNIEENAILEYRRQGRFLWETYFCSAEVAMDTVVAMVRARCLHAPPSVPDISAKTLINLGARRNNVNRNLALNNLTLYTSAFWNNPPGPFHFHRLTPFTPGPVSGMQYDHLTTRDVLNLPLHVLQAGGITGPYFEELLLGNHPPERFTIVILTFQRNEVLLEALERLKGTKFLDKVVVIWNNEESPDSSLEWNVDFPVEVGAVNKNTLFQ